MPPLPAPGDVSMCPSPPNVPGRNQNPDPDGPAPHIFEESTEFDQDCSLPSLSASTKRLMARDADTMTIQDLEYWDIERLQNASYFDGDSVIGYEELHQLVERDLVKRTKDKKAALQWCAAGIQPSQQYPSTYSGFRTIARLANRGWITIAKPAICGAIGVAAFVNQPANTEFVTEHVFEKQSLRDYMQYMTEGKLPGGAPLKAGAAVVKAIFDPNGGTFFSAWQGTAPSFGSTPWDTAFGCLGHAEAPANFDNLQVCDADLNAIKARIVKGLNFIDPKAGWGALGNQQKVDYLSDVLDAFSYMKFGQTVTSYNLAYKALITFWKAWAASPGAQTGYDYVGAFKDIVSADLDNQIKVATTLFKVLLKDATTTWIDPATTAKYAATVVTANQAALADFAKNLATYISYDKLGMLK